MGHTGFSSIAWFDLTLFFSPPRDAVQGTCCRDMLARHGGGK